MYAVVRNYSGKGAKELCDLLEAREAEVENLIRSVEGFVSYTFIRSDEGCVSVTVCHYKEGTDQSVELARNWIQENAADLGTSPPTVSGGLVMLHFGSRDASRSPVQASDAP